MSTPIDHVTLGLSRVTEQYKSAPDFNAYITALLQAPNNIELAGQAVAESLDIDVAEGVQLDRIGEIVGFGRDIPEAYPLPFFGFTDTPEGLPYGDDIFGGGGAFYEEGADNLTTWHLTDVQYRKFLRARILRNKSIGTHEDFIAILQLIFPTDGIIVRDVDDHLRISIGLDRATDVSETIILSYPGLLPKPGGVALVNLPFSSLITYFGFDPTGAPYGDDVVGGGGPFAEDTY